jgi:uncharacterized protein
MKGCDYMFRELRRTDKKANQDEAIKILLNGDYGVLSTHGENGYPYGVPVD